MALSGVILFSRMARHPGSIQTNRDRVSMGTYPAVAYNCGARHRFWSAREITVERCSISSAGFGSIITVAIYIYGIQRGRKQSHW